MLNKLLVLTLLLGSGTAFSQVAPSSKGGNESLSVGGDFSSFYSDYATATRIIGPGAFFDFNFTPKIGIEGEARWLHFNGTGGVTESDYLTGVRYRMWHLDKFSLNAKLLVGGVWVKYPYDIGNGSYFTYAPGIDAEYRLSKRFSARAGWEYQFLPSAPGLTGQPDNGLTPNGFSFGFSYKLIGKH